MVRRACQSCSGRGSIGWGCTFAVVDLVVEAFFSPVFALEAVEDEDLDVPFASLVGPEGPFGRSNSPAFSPEFSAAAMCLSKAASVVFPSWLLALTYFLIAWRL